MREKKSWFSNLLLGPKILVAIFVTALLCVTVFLFYAISTSHKKVIPLYFLPLLLGLVFEYWRISRKWKTVLATAGVTFILSLLVLARGKNETHYVFQEHLESWPYCFLGIFIIAATIVEYTKATKKLTEGITLLLTIAINYWIIANGYWASGNIVEKCLIIINVLISLFAIYNALSYNSLSKETRVGLSIWSSIIILILAADNFLQIYQNKDIEHLPEVSDKVIAYFQFFLLGVSSIYIAQNLSMISVYIPGKNYMQGIRNMNDIHLSRFSNEQVSIVDSIIMIIITLVGFGLNYFFQFVPINFMIWAMITIAPFLLYLIHKL